VLWERATRRWPEQTYGLQCYNSVYARPQSEGCRESTPGLGAGRSSAELRRRDFCWTIDGELLTFPDFPCADADVCGCGWSFAGITSARATTWGVVEVRSIKSIAAEVSRGKHLAGWSVVEGFEAHILAAIRDIGQTHSQTTHWILAVHTPSSCSSSPSVSMAASLGGALSGCLEGQLPRALVYSGYAVASGSSTSILSPVRREAIAGSGGRLIISSCDSTLPSGAKVAR
jgi:hypothetical protein